MHLCEVGDIADLGEGLHPLELVCHVQVRPSLPKVGEGGASVLTGIKINVSLSLTDTITNLEFIKLVDEHGADHRSCSAFPTLAVKSNHPASKVVNITSKLPFKIKVTSVFPPRLLAAKHGRPLPA